MKTWLQARAQAFYFWRRRRKYLKAARLVAPIDGLILSKTVYQQGLNQLADLSNWVERSGLLKGRPAKFQALEAKLGEITEALIGAAQIGNPGVNLQELADAYAAARLRGMPRKVRATAEYQQALASLLQRNTDALGRRHSRKAKAAATFAAAGPAGPAVVGDGGGNAGDSPETTTPQPPEPPIIVATDDDVKDLAGADIVANDRLSAAGVS